MKNTLVDDIANDFGEQFVERYMTNGFGAMSKSEIDILVFHLLTKSKSNNDEGDVLSNYEIASMLKITESRVKYLRLHSALRYGHDEPKEILARIFMRIAKDIQHPEFSQNDIYISLEDPIEKREFENAVKKAGRHVKYSLNKEVLSLSPIALMEIIVNLFDNPEKVFDEIVKKKVSDETDRKRILKKSNDFREKLNALGSTFNDHASSVTMLVAGITKLIG